MLKPGFTMYSRSWEALDRRTCAFCGKELTPHQAATASGVCGAPACHARMIERVGTELIARQRRELAEYEARIRDLSAPAIARALAALGVPADAPEGTVAIAVLPWQGEPLAPLAPERRAATARHIEGLAAAAFAGPVPDDDLEGRAEGEAESAPLVVAACAGCKGSCCASGGETAYVDESDLRRFRQRHPGTTAAGAVAAYLDALPERSVAGACVFQGAAGCTLPRALRNDRCNGYHCPELLRFQEPYAATRAGQAVLIAADPDIPRHVAAFDPVAGRIEVASAEPERGADAPAGLPGYG
jgi:hypothetical protein